MPRQRGKSSRGTRQAYSQSGKRRMHSARRHKGMAGPRAHNLRQPVHAKHKKALPEATNHEATNKDEEPKEPTCQKVDFEGLERGYSQYDAGVNKRLNGDFASAIKELQDARQSFHEHGKQESPMEAFASLELAKTAEESGNYTLARRSYEECKAMNPSSATVRLKLAQLEAKNGDLSDALIEAREACNLAPNAAEAHFVLSLILERAGAGAEAMVEKQRALQLAGSGAN